MRTLIIGDSQAAGPPGRALEERLRQQGDDVARVGHTGHGAGDWRHMHWAQYLELLARLQPQRVILMFGVNDLAGERLRQAMLDFRASAPELYYAGPPQYPTRPDAQARSVRVRELAQSVFGSRHLDAWPVSGPGVERTHDGLHFTHVGGAVWARGIAEELPQGGLVGLVVGGLVLAGAAAILWATLRVNQ